MDFHDFDGQRLLALDPKSTVVSSAPVTAHQCLRVDGGSKFFKPLRLWYLPVLHLLCTTAFTLGMGYWLNGKLFLISGSDTGNADHGASISQTDVNVIISACLAVSRTISLLWQGIAVWRCIIILLEKLGLTLAETNYIASWKLPIFALRAGALPRAAAVVLVLAWPVQLSNPIASGAVSWVPASNFRSTSRTVFLGNASKGVYWDYFLQYQEKRENYIRKAAGFASLGTASLYQSTLATEILVPAARRVAPQLNILPGGTAIENATVPIFNIKSFRWAQQKELSKNITIAVTDFSSQFLNLTDGLYSPLSRSVTGTSALLREEAWRMPSSDQLPPPSRASGTRYAAILVSRYEEDENGHDHDCRTQKSKFDALPPDVDFVRVNWTNGYFDCYVVAELQIEAGVTQCRQSPKDRSSNSTCLLSPTSSSIVLASNSTSSSDSLVQLALDMMPEVQGLGAALGLYDESTLGGKLEPYLRNSLVQAYQGAWSAMNEIFTNDTLRLEARAWESYPVLQAQVSLWRMYTWLAVNLLLTVSGVLLFWIQRQCEGRTVNDPVIAALLMDSSEVIGKDATGLCNTVDTGAGHGNLKLRVGLKISKVRNKMGSFEEGESRASLNASYFHPQLVPFHDR